MAARTDVKAAEAITSAIDRAVQKSMNTLGVATKKDLKAFEARIEKLESWASAVPAKKKAGRPPGSKSKRKTAAKKKAAKKPAAKKKAG